MGKINDLSLKKTDDSIDQQTSTNALCGARENISEPGGRDRRRCAVT